MNTKIIKFDLNRKLYEKIVAKQGDTKSRFLLFNLLDGSVPFNLTNRSVRVYGLKKDGTEIFNDLIINNATKGYCTLELTNQMLALYGEVELELMIMEGDKKLTSNIFILEVRKSINSEKAIVSTNEFTALLNGLASLNEYDNYKNEIKEARGGQTKLKDRLDNFDSHLEQIAYIPNIKKNVDNYLIIQNAINYCIANKKKLTLYDGVYLLSKQLEVEGDLVIEVIGDVTLKPNNFITKIINSNGKLTINGRLILDANNNANTCIYCDSTLPTIKGVVFKNSLSYCLENNSSKASGECILENYEVIDCYAGVRIVGDSISTSVTQNNCKTSGSTGYGGNCYFFSNHDYVNINGGEFTGHSTTSPNVYITKSANINGGRYHNIFRGATVGRLTKNFTIIGTINENCEFCGISTDLKNTDGTIPEGNGLVSSNVMKNCGYSLYSQAKNIEILNNYSVGHTKEDGAFRFNGADNVFVDGNSILCSGTQSPFSIAQNSKVNFGKNYTNSTDLGYRTDNAESINIFDDTRTVSKNSIVRQQDSIILVDATTGSLDLDFPQKTLSNNIGKKWTVIRIDSSSNKITVSLQNGDGTINGSTNALELVGGQYKKHEVISIGNGNYVLIS